MLVRLVEGFAGGGCPGAPGAGYNCVHNGLTVSEQKDVFLKTELLGGRLGGRWWISTMLKKVHIGAVKHLQSDMFYHLFIAFHSYAELEFQKAQEYHVGNRVQ